MGSIDDGGVHQDLPEYDRKVGVEGSSFREDRRRARSPAEGIYPSLSRGLEMPEVGLTLLLEQKQGRVGKLLFLLMMPMPGSGPKISTGEELIEDLILTGFTEDELVLGKVSPSNQMSKAVTPDEITFVMEGGRVGDPDQPLARVGGVGIMYAWRVRKGSRGCRREETK